MNMIKFATNTAMLQFDAQLAALYLYNRTRTPTDLFMEGVVTPAGPCLGERRAAAVQQGRQQRATLLCSVRRRLPPCRHR